jgi:hypothetical protein
MLHYSNITGQKRSVRCSAVLGYCAAVEYTACRYRAFCLCLCAEFKLTKCKRKQQNFLVLKPCVCLLCVCATGERTLFSIKTKSGALRVHHHADDCTHRLRVHLKRNQKTLFFAYFSARSLTRFKFCFEQAYRSRTCLHSKRRRKCYCAPVCQPFRI